MFIFRNILLATLFAGLALAFTSCDSSTSSDDIDTSEVPELPSFNEMEMQTQTFQGGSYSVAEKGDEPIDEQINNFTTQIAELTKKTLMENELQTQEFPSYTVASTLVMMFENFHRQNIGLQNNFLSKWNKDDADRSGDEYVWSYDVQDPETEETFSIEIRVSTNNEEANWAVIAEVDADDFQLEEQQIMEGTTALDGSSGDWKITLNAPNNEYNYESSSTWTVEDEILADMEFDLAATDTENATTVEVYGKYEADNNTGRIYDAWIDAPEIEEASQDLPWDVDLTNTFEIEWNLETEAGSISIGEQNYCWDENHSPTGC